MNKKLFLALFALLSTTMVMARQSSPTAPTTGELEFKLDPNNPDIHELQDYVTGLQEKVALLQATFLANELNRQEWEKRADAKMMNLSQEIHLLQAFDTVGKPVGSQEVKVQVWSKLWQQRPVFMKLTALFLLANVVSAWLFKD